MPQQASEERKLATVLFADIVGSTEIIEANDPELVRATLGRAFAEVRAIVVEHGGILEKFIGDAVMAIFGAPVSFDDHAERAVRAAWALRDAIKTFSDSSPIRYSVRVGINSGEVVSGPVGEGHHIVTGFPVNVAARLQQAAEPGEILVGALTRQLTRMSVEYGHERSIEAKGAGTLLAAPARGLYRDGPVVAFSSVAAVFVGREAELDVLDKLRSSTEREARPHIATIVGPPGQGKSRLFAEFAARLSPAIVWRIRCLPYGKGRAYAPLQDLLRSDLELGPGADAPAVRRAITARAPRMRDDVVGLGDSAISTLSSFVATSVGSGMPSLNDLKWALQRYCESRDPGALIVLGVEDAHWAEPALLDVVRHLGRSVRAALLVVCLSRPEVGEDHPEWVDGSLGTMIRLEPLSSQDSARLAAQLLPPSASADLAQAMASLAVGNPLYVEELARLLGETGPEEPVKVGGVYVIREVPASLHGIIAARLDRSGAEAKAVCQHASVIGPAFASRDLAVLLADSPDVGLAEALRRDILVEAVTQTGQVEFQFRHILIRDVAYRSLPKAQRSALHDRYSRWLEQDSSRSTDAADIIAYHSEQAHALAREVRLPRSELARRAIEALIRSARDASGGDARATLAFYERAEAAANGEYVTDRERLEIGSRIAMLRYDVHGGGAEVTAISHAIEAARPLGGTPEIVRLLALLGWIAVQSESVESAARLYAEALALARDAHEPSLVVEALLASGEISMFTGEFTDRAVMLHEALLLAEQHGLSKQRAAVLRGLSFLDFQRGDYVAATSRRIEADALDPPTDPVQRAAAAEDACYHAHITGRFTRAVELGREAVAVAVEIGSRALIGRCYRVLAEALYSRGMYGEARSACEAAVSAFDPSMAGHLCEVEATLALVCTSQGDIASARRAIDAARQRVVSHDVHGQATTRAAEAAVLAAEGRLDAADAAFRDALATVSRTGFGNATMETRRAYAEFLIANGRDAEARSVLRPAIDFFSDPLATGMRDRLARMVSLAIAR